MLLSGEIARLILGELVAIAYCPLKSHQSYNFPFCVQWSLETLSLKLNFLSFPSLKAKQSVFKFFIFSKIIIKYT
jgi:hypothetical protein